MKLPKIIEALVSAQNSYDSKAYADCFSENAIVFDEGKNHEGRGEIREWIEEANEKYRTVLQVADFHAAAKESILTVNVSGNFDGSPTVMKYHMEIDDELIRSLKITG